MVSLTGSLGLGPGFVWGVLFFSLVSARAGVGVGSPKKSFLWSNYFSVHDVEMTSFGRRTGVLGSGCLVLLAVGISVFPLGMLGSLIVALSGVAAAKYARDHWYEAPDPYARG